MNKYRIENPNNNKVREYKSRTTELSAPAIIAADMAWEGMKQIYSNIDNWGRNLPNQIINSH